MMETEWRPESLDIAATLAARAEALGCSAGQYALAWVLHNPLVTGAVVGPRTMVQWEDYLGALAVTLTAEDEALVDGLVTPGHPSTPGYNDPQYPLEGRPLRG
jgi:aryl-alcohol dehydrogenase (NADP+)